MVKTESKTSAPRSSNLEWCQKSGQFSYAHGHDHHDLIPARTHGPWVSFLRLVRRSFSRLYWLTFRASAGPCWSAPESPLFLSWRPPGLRGHHPVEILQSYYLTRRRRSGWLGNVTRVTRVRESARCVITWSLIRGPAAISGCGVSAELVVAYLQHDFPNMNRGLH